jgi:FkbM family methyltransferase
MLKHFTGIAFGALRALLVKVRNVFVDQYGTKFYSQEGEDVALCRLLEGKRTGYYVDVGAHHPRRFSNTYYFYRLGWSGINIEPNPESIEAFRKERPRDINLHIGIADDTTELSYFYFDEPALNTFDESLARSRLSSTHYKHIKTGSISVAPLARVLEKHLPPGQAIDFLTVDVEGLDLSVLKSNDWTRFRPRYVVAEAIDLPVSEALGCDLSLFLKSQEYDLVSKLHNSLIFRDLRT